MKLLSVIIVTYNSEKHIYDCLEAINKYNDIGDSLEIIIVDNCSNYVDELETSINNIYGDDITFIRNTKNGGYGQGNNIGIKASSAPYVFIMNPDVRLTEPVFKKCIEYLDTNINCAMYGMHQDIPGLGKGRSFGLSFRKTDYITIVLYWLFRKMDIFLQKLMYIQGSCFVIRKCAFANIGLFDENIFMYSEEDDIHDRLIENGYYIHYERTVHYQHLHKPQLCCFDESYCLLNKDLETKLYWNRRDGYSDSYTIKIEIKIAKINILRENIKRLLGMHNQEYLEYMKGWLSYLNDYRNRI